MSNSYSRRCRHCNRWISMRQMPAGQWVAFEKNQPHNCAVPTPQPGPLQTPNVVARPSPNTASITRSNPQHQADLPSLTQSRPPATVPRPALSNSPPAPARSAPAPSSSSPGSPLSGGYRPFAAPPRALEKAIPEASQLSQPQSENSIPGSVTWQSELSRTGRSFSRIMERVGGTLWLIMVLYIVVGAIHSTLFELFVSRSDCLYPKGLVAVYCKAGMGLAHLTVVLGWPFYWLY
jgi:hypothetical protein